MHYFSIHTQQGEHLGFFIMLPDDESEAQPQSGRFAVKLQSETTPQDKTAVNILALLQNSDTPLYWQIEKDYVTLSNDNAVIGKLRNEYLTVNGQTLVLTDLTGII